MMNMKKMISRMVVAGLLLVPVLGYAADETDIEKLEKQLVQKETELLDPELKLDQLLVERAKLDGMGGWFQGSKKKELDRKIGEAQTSINTLESQMSDLAKQVQEMVFVVASTYEKKGEYKKAIEYYLKVERQDDSVRSRIAGCYKALKDYEQAIQWYLKMARSDQNLLEVVDCYKLDGRMKEAIYWLFTILEPLDGNPAELTALELIEKYDYAGKKNDYPNFNQRLADVYLAKAVLNYQKDFAQAKVDYEKAISLMANGGDAKSVSLGIVSRYQSDYKAAMDMLDQQRDAAERNYENMLQEAKREYDETEYRYRRAQRDAEDEYSRRLEETRRELDRAEHDLAQLQKQASPSADLIAQGQRRVTQARDNYQYVINNRNRIVDDYVHPYRRRMDEAMDHYRDIMNRRTEIIERYIAPYKAQVASAKQAVEMIRTLHDSVYR